MIASSLLVALLLAAPSGMLSAEPAAALQKEVSMSPADRAETSRRFLTAATLHRGDLIAALEAEGEGLDPALLEVVLEAVYPIESTFQNGRVAFGAARTSVTRRAKQPGPKTRRCSTTQSREAGARRRQRPF